MLQRSATRAINDCMRDAHRNKEFFSTIGSEPTCGGAENISLSSEYGCRLSALRFVRFAPAANSHFPPKAKFSHARIEQPIGLLLSNTL